MLFSPVPVLFIPLFPLYCFVLFCLVGFSLLTAFPLKIVFLRLCSKLRQLPEWYQVLPFCHVSLPVPPSLSWLWALWVLCDQFFLFFFFPYRWRFPALLLSSACLVFSLFSDTSLLLSFSLYLFIPVTSASSSISNQPMSFSSSLNGISQILGWKYAKSCLAVRDKGGRWSELDFRWIVWLELSLN